MQNLALVAGSGLMVADHSRQIQAYREKYGRTA